ncbi:ArnT family glycosyltransferase [Algoriphagus pacificus]|uniref:Glycosyltransferase family 39 protein n=1 Tax=Algoriphagus pacificus TaxID=2811234 RepID=A0ABS3CJD7_9BACT|nr:glycosyltransferase family 39 protein [Algoriphagus pacificus]MBN7816659.1 glycosyltransferase family 39 protein [Algoriphagus pacificus]
MKTHLSSIRHKPHSKNALIAGMFFLVLFWVFGFDGITFSDDVYYLLAGKSFWQGTMEVNSYHFSSRWGAYVPSGFFGYLFGFNPHVIAGFSAVCYLLSLVLLYKILPNSCSPWILVLWFSTQVYFMHFITKVYPDAPLVFWVTLVPFAANFRQHRPFMSGIILVLALFGGFLTKETIIFLAPFPILLFLWDWKNRSLNPIFYYSILATGLIFSLLYLGYFWIQFGDPLYRVTSINAGHYISEFTYADKGIWSILKRLTITPLITFVERVYWPWMVFAIPGIYEGFKSKEAPVFEFSLAFLLLLLGFWFMSSTLEFYNPIYLNPRHLIILIPILSFLISIGWNVWASSRKWKINLSILILAGSLISVFQGDFKQVVFLMAFTSVIWLDKKSLKIPILALLLIFPALYSIHYQKELKQYEALISTIDELTHDTERQGPILTNNFIHFSREVILPYDESGDPKRYQDQLVPIESIYEMNQDLPEQLTILIYQYYQHAYPKEQEDVDRLETWLKKNNYVLDSEIETGNLWIRHFHLP